MELKIKNLKQKTKNLTQVFAKTDSSINLIFSIKKKFTKSKRMMKNGTKNSEKQIKEKQVICLKVADQV